MSIKKIAYKFVLKRDAWGVMPIEHQVELLTEFIAELAKENKPVAWMYEYSYDLNGDKQGHWPVEMYTHVSFSRSKPSVESTPLYTLPPTAEQIEQQTAEAIAKHFEQQPHVEHFGDNIAEAIRSGAWKEYK